MNVMILNLMMAHFIGDFYCQYKRMCDKKIIESTCIWSPTIFIHSLIIGILSMMFLCDLNAWTIVLSIFIYLFMPSQKLIYLLDFKSAA